MNQKPSPDDSSVTLKSSEESDWSDKLNSSCKHLEMSSGRFHNLHEVRIDSKWNNQGSSPMSHIQQFIYMDLNIAVT